jgi:hypothetical protein
MNTSFNECRENSADVDLGAKAKSKLHWRTRWRIRESVRFLLKRYGRNCTWVTLGFAENYTELEKPQKCLKLLRQRILRWKPASRAVGVWQRQKRGAWHVHLVLSHRVARKVFVPVAEACGFGHAGVDFKGIDLRYGADGVASYMTRYLGHGDGGKWPAEPDNSLVTGWGGGMVAKGRFVILGGLAEIYWRGRYLFGERDASEMKQLDWMYFVRASRDDIMRIGWTCLTAARATSLLKNQSVRNWFSKWKSLRQSTELKGGD